MMFLLMVLYPWQNKQEATLFQYPKLKHFPQMIATDNPPTVEGATLGRYLFYDPILSKDSTFSCASCHKQQFAFSDSPNRLSKGINGSIGSRNTMPLFNLPWYRSFFWDGKVATLEEQVFHPVRAHNEMGLDWETVTQRIKKNKFYVDQFAYVFENQAIDSVLVSKAIAQFERTLISNNSKFDQVLRGETYLTPEEFNGLVLMNDQIKGNCLHCHTTDNNALGTTGNFSNNGLDNFSTAAAYYDKGKGGITNKVSDIGLFKIPSLRNIAVTAPYMHDGRFQTLEEVLDFYSQGVQHSFNLDSKMKLLDDQKAMLTAKEKENIIQFLHTLTDSVFLTNPQFNNPFPRLG